MSERNDAPQQAKNAVGAKKKAAVAAVCLAAAVLAGGYGVLCGQVKETNILPKTVVNGVDLSGMTREEAAKALMEDFQARYTEAKLEVSVEGGEPYTVKVGNTLSLDAEAVAAELLEVNQGPYLLRGAAQLRAMTMGQSLRKAPSVTNTDKLAKNIKKSGLMDINTTVQTGYEVNKDGDLDIHMGVTGYSVDKEALTEDIYSAVAADDYETVIECPLLTGTVEELNWRSLEEDVCRDAADATLSLSEDRRSYEFVESVDSVRFDLDAAKASVSQAKEGDIVTVPLTYQAPEITTEDLKENLFRDTLGSYESTVKGTEGRRANVRLAAQKCNGIILLPGDSFAYNETLGERTAENGFFTAPAYLYGETVQEYGGGICQVSSTLYSATLYANLQIDERHNHTFASSYVPLGMDATVSWEGPDFKFTNNQKYPIRLDVEYWNSQNVVHIMGTKTDDIKVEIESDVLDTKAYTTKKKDDPTRYVGQTYVDQHGVNGYLVQTYRILLDGEGNQISREKESYSDYTPETEIILVGTKKKKEKKPKKSQKKETDKTTDTNTAKPTAAATTTAQ